MLAFWSGITNTGDAGLIFPLAFFLFLNLIFLQQWRVAAIFGGVFSAGMGLVLGSKIAFTAWGLGIPALGFRGFSGHAAQATSLLPIMLASALNLPGYPQGRKLGLILGLALGAIVAVSRVELELHSVSEVLSGWVLGAGLAYLFYRFKLDQFSREWVMLLLAVLLLIVLSGRYTPPQTIHWVWHWSAWLQGLLH